MATQRKGARPGALEESGADVRSADESNAQRRADLREEQSQARAAQRAARDPKNPFARPAVLINGVEPRWPIAIHQPEASMSAEERAEVAAGQARGQEQEQEQEQEQVADHSTPRGGTNAPHAFPEE